MCRDNYIAKAGCILSPLVFLLVMEWIPRQATENKNCGIQWKDGKRLTDLDFADYIPLVDDTRQGMRELTGNIDIDAASVGLRIKKTQTNQSS